MKTCTKCGEAKTLDRFFKWGRTCRDCKNEYLRDWRAKNRERVNAYSIVYAAKYRTESRDKRNAHQAVSNALRAGRLIKAPCVICGATEHVHGHHDNYSRRLDVTWLCVNHHNERHVSLAAQ